MVTQDFYETTLEALKDAKNERLWFKTNLKLGKLWLDMAEFNRQAQYAKRLVAQRRAIDRSIGCSHSTIYIAVCSSLTVGL